MALSPTKRNQWAADSAPLAVIILTLVFTYKRYRFTNLSYFVMFVFFCLHTYAAHYTYEGTPFDHWLKSSFHTKRSYYDRVVHLFFGLLCSIPFLEILKCKAKLRGFWSYFLTVVAVLGFSAAFEILEMLAALAAGKGGEAKFVGMQGDIFDTQKDMALGLLGGAATMGIAAWINRRKKKSV
ncbi:DUF2238 domain-containing protein [Cohnella faecalis]|uniref:DUF2238 domain-containing protein n=2 Tax=Cohnella faecalis TaxID=2315694 RepID=A0A398CRU8_9BACL|nr:DUF2238 domain-containing protein [Cohnella faecalis]